jgi:hypothetical protein
VSIGGKLVHVIATGKGYGEGSARGLRIGSILEEMGLKYGKPSRVLTSRQETNYVYKKAEVVFGVNHEGRVSGWTIFAVQ